MTQVPCEDKKSERVIGCLAAIHNRLVEKDYISSYIPFVSTILLEISNEVEIVNVDTVVERFSQKYGFEIFHAPMVSILSKCVQKGIVTRSRQGCYSINVEECRKAAISEEEVKTEVVKYQRISRDLRAFYKERYRIDSVSERTVEEKLLLFLDKYSVRTITISFENNTDAIFVDGKALSDEDHFFIISQFILSARNNNWETYALIQNLAMAHLMSSCIAYTDKRDEKSQIDAFKYLHIYIDTPWLLRIIGVYEEDVQTSEIDLLKRLQAIGARFSIFRHTYDETMHILTDCLYWMDNPQCDVTYGSSALRTFIKRKFKKTDVEEFVDSFDYALKLHNIDIDDEDYYTGRYYHSAISEKTIADTIVEAYSSNPSTRRSPKKGTIENDAKSIGHILKRWGTKRGSTYRQVQDVFVTTNETLAYASRKLPAGYNKNEINKVYPCISNIYLGTNIWLSAPVKTFESFSINKLVANCLTQIEPSEKLILALQASIDRYSKSEEATPEKLYLLRTKAFENDYLTNATLGDADRFNDSIREELIENIEEEIRRPDKEENQRLSTELTKYQNQEKRISDTVRQKEEKADTIIKIASRSSVIGLIIAVLTLIINISGVIDFPSFIIIVCSVALFIFAVIEVILKAAKEKLKKTMVHMFLLNEGIMDEYMQTSLKD